MISYNLVQSESTLGVASCFVLFRSMFHFFVSPTPGENSRQRVYQVTVYCDKVRHFPTTWNSCHSPSLSCFFPEIIRSGFTLGSPSVMWAVQYCTPHHLLAIVHIYPTTSEGELQWSLVNIVWWSVVVWIVQQVSVHEQLSGWNLTASCQLPKASQTKQTNIN